MFTKYGKNYKYRLLSIKHKHTRYIIHIWYDTTFKTECKLFYFFTLVWPFSLWVKKIAEHTFLGKKERKKKYYIGILVSNNS